MKNRLKRRDREFVALLAQFYIIVIRVLLPLTLIALTITWSLYVSIVLALLVVLELYTRAKLDEKDINIEVTWLGVTIRL